MAAELCIDTDKDKDWGHNGKLGFPAALLLLAFIDSAGFLLFIKDTDDDKGADTTFGLAFERYVASSFPDVSNEKNKVLKETLANSYRKYIVHQSGLPPNTSLSIDNSDEILTKSAGGSTLHLVPLLKNCKEFYNRNLTALESKSSLGRVGTL